MKTFKMLTPKDFDSVDAALSVDECADALADALNDLEDEPFYLFHLLVGSEIKPTAAATVALEPA